MKVAVFLGSESDREYTQKLEAVLKDFHVSFETIVCSAHRAPKRLVEEVRRVENEGAQVLIGLAGYAAHLPGALAAHSHLPVIGVPLPTSTLEGVDSILSIAQMPGGVPVATMSIGHAGAKNAALLSVQILALSDRELSQKWLQYKQSLCS
ncbi:MAG: 5-(carboxyamino)imidazole ribonucleotide mutase [Deltaproteobacteria bacterium]|nr:5-(carboxyamino)imidazole ribonucleotide mutase [Deltaproteobacteria bacterium]